MAHWFVLGFSVDDVVGAWQDWRLARQCVGVLTAADRPLTAGILESAGAGEHLIYWYVDEEVAGVLDEGGVPWRRFLVGDVDAPPEGAIRHLRAG
ncbi:MAG TPA: hypothetical protein VF334_23120 [Polyangia bacterium]